MNPAPFRVWSEQLLLPFRNLMVGMQVRLFEPEAPVGTVVCFHGFAGNGGDFDALAHCLARNGYMVVCPDMIGRGASGNFDTPRRYSFRNSVKAAAAVFGKYGTAGTTVVATGWSAVITLLVLEMARPSVARLLLCETPLDYAPSSDPILQQAAADVGISFKTRDEAARHVLASPEFAAAEAHETELVAHRVRQTEAGFRLNYDDGIVGRLDDVAGRNFDLGELFRRNAPATLLLYGRNLDAKSRAAVEAVRARNPGVICVDGLTPAGPLLLRTPAELLIALGFIGNRATSPRAG